MPILQMKKLESRDVESVRKPAERVYPGGLHRRELMKGLFTEAGQGQGMAWALAVGSPSLLGQRGQEARAGLLDAVKAFLPWKRQEHLSPSPAPHTAF